MKEPKNSTTELLRQLKKLQKQLAVCGRKNAALTGEMETLNKDLKRYKTVVENAREGLWYEDLVKNETWFSPSWRAIHGYRDDDITKWGDAIHDDDRGKVDAALTKVFQGQKTAFECEFRVRYQEKGNAPAKSPRCRLIHSHGKLIRDANNNPIALVGSDMDVTQSRYYEEMLNAIPSLLFMKDKNFRFTYVNKAMAEAYLGKDADPRILLESTDARFNKNKRQVARFRRDDKKVLRMKPGESLRISEEELDYKDKSKRTLATVKFAMRSRESWDPDEVEVFGIATDITQLKRELKKERQLFKNLMDHVEDAVYFKGPDGAFVRGNQELAKMFGCDSPEELEGKKASDFPFIGEKLAQQWQQDEDFIFKNGKALTNIPTQFKRSDGDLEWRLVSKWPIRDELPPNHVVQIVCISRNFTDFELTKEKLETQKRLLQQIFDNICDNVPECIWIKDLNLRYKFCNRSFLERYKNVPQLKDPYGKTDQERWSEFPEQGREYLRTDREIIATGERKELFEEFQRWPDGTEHRLLTTKIPLKNERGEVIEILGIYQDITKEDSQRSHVEIAERISHCLKNWTEVLSLSCANLQHQVPTVKKHPAFKRLLNAIQFLRQSANKAHMFSTRSNQAMLEELRFNELVTEVISLKSDVCIQFKPDPKDPICAVDKRHLRNLFLELLSNAGRELQPNGKDGLIDVSVESDDEQVILHVCDNGPGIPPDIKPILLNPTFKSGDDSRTGLGLAYVISVVEMHRGKIKEIAPPGQGAHFVVTLPKEDASKKGV